MLARTLTLALLAFLLPITSAHADFTQNSSGKKPLSWDRQKADKIFIFTDKLFYGSEIQTGARPTVPREASTTMRDPYYPPTPRAYYYPPYDYSQTRNGTASASQTR